MDELKKIRWEGVIAFTIMNYILMIGYFIEKHIIFIIFIIFFTIFIFYKLGQISEMKEDTSSKN